MAENPEENQNEEPIEISVGREDVEKKPEEEQGVPIGPTGEQGIGQQEGEEKGQGESQGASAGGEKGGEEKGQGDEEGEEKGEGEEGEEKSDEPGDKEGEEKGEDGEPKPSDEGEEEDGEGEEESEEEKEDREKKEKEKQDKREQEDKEEKEKRDKEDSEKSPDKKKKEKRDKEDQKKKEKRDKEDKKDKQDQRDKKDKSDKEKRDQEDREEQEKRDKEDEKDQQETDPKKREQKQKERKEKRASEDWDKKKKREKEDKKKKESRDKEDKSDSIIWKKVMIVYGETNTLGEIFTVKKLLNTDIVDAELISFMPNRELKIGEKLPVYELESDVITIATSRINFILVDGGDSILWQEGYKKYTNEIKQINIPEKALGVETEAGVYWVVVDKVLKSIPQTKADKEKKEQEEKEKEDGLFHSLSVILVKDVVEIFKAKGLAPPTEDTFLVCHFPRRIYSIYKKLLIQDGLNDAELMERTGSSLEDFRELDKYLAKMILKQFQIAGYYYDPAHAFDNILYDNLKVLNVFESKNVLVKRPSSSDTISVFRDGKTLSVHSNILGYTFLEDILFGERKNIVKFGLWENHKYEKIQELYNFLEFVVSTSRLSDEDKSIIDYQDINNEIANIYNSQLKALENAI